MSLNAFCGRSKYIQNRNGRSSGMGERSTILEWCQKIGSKKPENCDGEGVESEASRGAAAAANSVKGPESFFKTWTFHLWPEPLFFSFHVALPCENSNNQAPVSSPLETILWTVIELFEDLLKFNIAC